jgi:hypothetical protein
VMGLQCGTCSRAGASGRPMSLAGLLPRGYHGLHGILKSVMIPVLVLAVDVTGSQYRALLFEFVARASARKLGRGILRSDCGSGRQLSVELDLVHAVLCSASNADRRNLTPSPKTCSPTTPPPSKGDIALA